jgi:hypothetical protein
VIEGGEDGVQRRIWGGFHGPDYIPPIAS